MRHLKQFTLIMLMVLMGTMVGHAQKRYLQDTIRIEMPNKTSVEFRTNYNGRINQLKDLKIEEQLQDFLKKWEAIGGKINPNNKPIAISFKDKFNRWGKIKEETGIVIKTIQPTNKFTFPSKKSEVLTQAGKNRLTFKNKYNNIIIYFDTIEQLKEMTQYKWDDILKNTDNTVEKKIDEKSLRRYAFSLWAKTTPDNNSEYRYSKVNSSYSQNALEITANTGLCYIKDRWNMSINLQMDLLLHQKGLLRYKIGLNYETMFDFKNGKRNINQWLDLSYSQKLPFFKYSWTNISLGYLIKKQGDLFKKNTFRMGFETYIKNTGISVTPQLYFEGFFKKGYPGVKIGISL